MKIILSFFLTLFGFCALAQDIDVQHYKYDLMLSDATDKVRGEAEITVTVKPGVKNITLDFVQQNAAGKGMKVEKVTGTGVSSFSQKENHLTISLAKPAAKEQEVVATIIYSGIPADGLIISKNKYGERTFFADNWPNRAHNWIPCIDRPDDKATFEFIVTAPDHYEVVSNGKKTEETALSENRKRTHWVEDVSLPSKVMVIGVARFAVKQFDDSPAEVPVSAWVYPQDSTKGFYDYGIAPSILKFFSSYIAPYPYNKLANVQSKTIFGGMENASSIFYAESLVTGDRKIEDVIAHEIAHQWFGDMASEKSFAHLWLSEGFATYMTDLYFEKTYGIDAANNRLRKERNEVIEFMQKTNHPVVDSTTNLMSLLNANSYQKGAWILHMLRKEVGDSTFHQIIQTYYQQYKGGNADTRDLEKIAEKVSGKDLKRFFDQWLYLPGIPSLKLQWHYENGMLDIDVQQTGKNIYRFPLTIACHTNTGWNFTTLNIANQKENISVQLGARPTELILDPHVSLLFEGSVSEK